LAAECRRSAEAVRSYYTKLHTITISRQTSALPGDIYKGNFCDEIPETYEIVLKLVPSAQ